MNRSLDRAGARWLGSRPAILALLALAVAAIVAATLPRFDLRFDNRIQIWFYDEDPGIASYDRVVDLFGEWSWIMVSVAPETGTIYERGFVAGLKDLSRRLEGHPDIKRVISLGSAKTTVARVDSLYYTDIWEADDGGLLHGEALRRRAEADRFYGSLLIKRGDPDATLVLIQEATDIADGGRGRQQLVADIDRLVGESGLGPHTRVGPSVINAELNRISSRDLAIFLPLVSLLAFAVARVVTGTWRDSAILMAAAGLTVYLTTTAMFLSGLRFDLVNIVLPALLLCLASASGVHMIVHFHSVRAARPATSSGRAARETIAALWAPCLISNATTAAGFLSLIDAGVMPIAQLSRLATIGLAITFVVTVATVPLLLALAWQDARVVPGGAGPRLHGARPGWARAFNRLAAGTRGAARRPVAVGLAAVVLAAAVAGGMARLEADSTYIRMFEDDTRIKADYDRIAHQEFGSANLTLLVEAPDGIADPAVVETLTAIEADLLADDRVHRVIGPLNVLREVDRALGGSETSAAQGLAGYGRDQLAQLLFVADLVGNEDLADFLSHTREEARMEIFMDYMTNAELQAFEDRIAASIAHHDNPGVEVSITGLSSLWANMDGYLFDTQIRSMVILTVVFLTVLLAVFRSVRLAVLGVVANFVPVMAILAAMGWLAVDINIGTILVAGVSFGIAVDDTVHLLWRLQRKRGEGRPLDQALEEAMREVGPALTATTAIILGGFAVLTLSDFVPIADMGLFSALTVAIALAFDLAALPVLVLLLDRRRATLRAG